MKVFICFTPLHVLIATKIIEVEKMDKYVFIYFTDLDTEKNKYYYNRLAKKAVASYYIILLKKVLQDIIIIYKLSKEISKYQNLEYYSGKIKSSHNRLLMYLTNYNNFITFDDGSGNISGDGYFYNTNENLLFKSFFYIFNKKLLYKNIKISMIKHYSIFNLPNVFPKVHYITLFNTDKTTTISTKKTITILLSNAFAEDHEMQLDDEIQLYKKVLKNHSVTHIIKHPREKFKKIQNNTITEINSVKIAEEIILEYMRDYNLIIIGMHSTTLLNLANIYNIKLININALVKKPIESIINILDLLSIETYND